MATYSKHKDNYDRAYQTPMMQLLRANGASTADPRDARAKRSSERARPKV